MRLNRTSVLPFALASLAATAVLGIAAAPSHAQLPEGVTVGGQVEVNYTFNFNQPSNNSNTFLYNQREGQFSLNLAEFRLIKAATPRSRTGFTLRFVGGEVSRLNFNPGDDNRIMEAYGTQLIPLGARDLKFDAGIFVTHVGYETIDIGTNNFFSRNWLFQYPSPFYNAGVRAALPLGSRTTFTGFLLNRYNGVVDDGNRDIAPGFQLAHTLSSRSSVVLNGLYSRETLGTLSTGDDDRSRQVSGLNVKPQSVLDLIYTNQFTDRFKFVVEGLYRFGKDAANDSYNWGGVAGYGIFTLKSGNILGLRGEYLSPSTLGAAAANGGTTSLSSATLSYELRSGLFPNSRTIFEARHDIAGKEFFLNEDGDAKKSQTTFTLGQVFTF